MELWIRSQSRERLEKANQIELVDCTQLTKTINDIGSGVLELIKNNDQMNQYLIDGFAIKVNETFLGTYTTKERALEVLDEIQNFIEKQGTSDAISNEQGILGIKFYGKVYEMPKE